MLSQEISTGPSSGGAAYGDNSSHLPREASLDALYLSHMSPVIQLSQFPDCSPSSSRRSSLQEDPLQSIYLDTEVMQRYYQEPDICYGPPPSSGSLHSPMYTAESSAMLGHDTSTLVGDLEQARHDWSTNDVMLISPHEPVFSPAYGYSQSDSAESVDIYAPTSYPIHTYDSFEFQTLRDHNTSAMLAGQHA